MTVTELPALFSIVIIFYMGEYVVFFLIISERLIGLPAVIVIRFLIGFWK